MVCKRLIGVIIIKNDWAVQSINFCKFLPVGKPEIAVEYLSRWDVDEILVLDISASKNKNSPNLYLLENIAKKCNVPLTYGGGIKTIQDISNVINIGAEKVSINSQIFNNPQLISEGAELVGKQAIIVSIDVIRKGLHHYVFNYQNSSIVEQSPIDFAKYVSDLGAGEIFLNSVDRDGMKNGYDFEIIKSVKNNINIPLIICGGVGCFEHFYEGLSKLNVSAVAAANIFHYSEHSVITAKSYLKNQFIKIRLNEEINYMNYNFNESSRIY